MAAFITKRVIVEVIPTIIGEGEASIGQRVDGLIYVAMEQGHMLQTVSFELDESEWAKMETLFKERNLPHAVEPAKKVAR